MIPQAGCAAPGRGTTRTKAAGEEAGLHKTDFDAPGDESPSIMGVVALSGRKLAGMLSGADSADSGQTTQDNKQLNLWSVSRCTREEVALMAEEHCRQQGVVLPCCVKQGLAFIAVAGRLAPGVSL